MNTSLLPTGIARSHNITPLYLV
uniref:Uncharacterized protein n=1 Tax=Anguilla anguilla TaxID=7936 RepID=A0A0E9TH11_ANGAN